MEFFKYLFDSDSVAVIGASNTPGTWGFGVMNTLFSSSKKRKIWPVTKSASEVLGIKAYRSIIEVPEEVDFAVISVPASEVPGVMRQCVEKEVNSALIISGGLAESGEDGARIEEKVVQIARLGGLRFIGPNSMGHADTSSDFSTLAWLREIKKGPIGFISQSGTYGERLVNTALAAGLGFSKFISSGNEADLHLEDYLECLAQDEDTQIIALYVEGLREGRRFFNLAKEITRKKPIVVLKSGRTEGSSRAAMSHTSALSGSDIVYDAAFRQAGVTRVEDDDQLFDVTTALLQLPLPRGNRVGILTEGGGIGVMAAEACERAGLKIPRLSPSTMDRLNSILPSRWSHGNPVDMTDVITSGKLVTFSCLQEVMEGWTVDAAMVIGGLGVETYFRFFMTSPSEKLAHLADLLAEEERKGPDLLNELVYTLQKPVVAVKLIPEAVHEPEIYDLLRRKGIPVYPNPQRAATALAYLVQRHEYLESLGQGEQVYGKVAVAIGHP